LQPDRRARRRAADPYEHAARADEPRARRRRAAAASGREEGRHERRCARPFHAHSTV